MDLAMQRQQQSQQQQSQPETSNQGEIEPGQEGQDPMTQMVVQIDQGLTKLAQVIGKASPEAGQALMQVNEQYRQIMTAVMNGGGQQQGGGQKPASPMVSPETQGKPSMQAY